MKLEHCVAQAIHDNLDIVEALPSVTELPLEKIQPRVQLFVQEIQEKLSRAILLGGEPYLRTRDATGLCSHLLSSQVPLPLPQLLKMSETIVSLYPTQVTIMETARGPIYLMRMTI